MPGLIAFHRRWEIGSDDLMFPALFEITVRLFWLIGIAIVFNTHRLSFDCSHGTLVHAYYIGIMVILICHIVANIAIVTVSTRGTIMDPSPRRHMHLLLYLKVALYVPELLWTCLGTYWAFDESSNCKSYVAITVKVAACVGWAVFLTLILAILIVFDPIGSLRNAAEFKRSAAVKIWETRFRVICCCTMCDDKHADAFTDTSKLLAQFFQDVDLVATDIAAGLLLVHELQKEQPCKYKYQSLSLLKSPSQLDHPDNTGDDAIPGTSSSDDIPDLIVLDQPDDIVPSTSPALYDAGTVVIESQPRSGRDEWEQFSADGAESNHLSNGGGSSNHRKQQQKHKKILDKNHRHKHTGHQSPVPCDSEQINVLIDSVHNSDPWSAGQDVGGLFQRNGHAKRTKPLEVKDWMSLENAAHYMEYCVGTYTWPMYLYLNWICGPCKLCAKLTCCHRASRHYHDNIIADNCCECHLAALLKVIRVQRRDILYANFNNRIYEIPFYVALDHKMRAVVIAIRGTMSLKDCLTDMTAECAHYHIEGLGEQYVHKGILQAAKYIQNQLEKMDLLAEAFQRAPNYNLVVTGHSLGAGAAALLAILLRPKYRYIQCYALSPPGWLLSLPLSRYTEDFVVSVVIGEDVVPRLGIRTMERLKVKILKVIRDQNQPKYHIIAGGCWRFLFSSPQPSEQRLVQTATSHRTYTQPEAQTQERTVQDDVEEAIHESDRACGDAQDLYMPGVVLYLQEEEPMNPIKSLCWSTPKYKAVWGSQHQFQEILVTPKMLTNHMPDVMLKALKHSADKGVQARSVMTDLGPEE